MGDELCPITDTENRDAEVIHLGVDRRGAVHVDRLGTTREDDANRLALGDLRSGDRVRDDFGIDVGLSNTPCDELCVLGTEVDDEDGLLGRVDCGHRALTKISAFWKSLRSVYPHIAID